MKKSFRRLSMKIMSLVFVGGMFSSSAAHADPLSSIINAALTSLTSAVTAAISGVISGTVSAINTAINGIFTALFGTGSCAGTGSIGDVMCNFAASIETIPGFVSAMAYLIGIIMTITALLKLKDHVLDGGRTPLSDSMKRFLAGSALFSLPTITEALQNAMTDGYGSSLSAGSSGYAGSVSGGGGLDTMMVALFLDIFTPLMGLLYSFGYMAGLVFTVLGIMRIIQTAQQGPRGPSGVGTIMTFVVAGVLFSTGTIMSAFSVSLFGDSEVATFAVLNTSSGDADVDEHILAVISTVLVFMTIIGWISFLRGFFILRDVAEGNGQASLMVSMTHMFGGALAVNLGPLMNAVQTTFGLDSFGVSFTQ